MESITLQTNDTIVVSGDLLGQLQFAASSESDGGSATFVVAKVYAQGEGAFSASSNPASLIFATSSNDNLAATGRIKVDDNGNLLPMENYQYSLGRSGLAFSNLYANSGYFSSLQVNNTPVPTGVGTSGYVTRWTTSSALSTGILYDNGTNVGIGTASPTGKLHVVGTGLFASATGLPANGLLSVYSTASGATLFSVEGTNGNLFTVVDSTSGSLMSVNDITGLGAFEVFSDHSIVAGRYNQNDFVLSSGGNLGLGIALPSGKLHVIGNTIVSGNLGIGNSSPSYKLDVTGTGNFSQNLLVNGTGVSLSGHTHTSSEITDFNSSVSGLLPVKNIVAGSGIGVTSNSGVFTVNSLVMPTVKQIYPIAASSGTFTVSAGYSIGYLDIFHNGVKLSSGDYTATNGTTFTLTSPAISGDVVEAMSSISSLNLQQAMQAAYINALNAVTNNVGGMLYLWANYR